MRDRITHCSMLAAAAACAIALAGAGESHALVIDFGDGSGNTSVDTSSGDPKELDFAEVFLSVGQRSASHRLSGLYLGQNVDGYGVVLTTEHGGSPTFLIDGTGYQRVTNSVVQLVVPEGQPDAGELTDLAVYLIEDPPEHVPGLFDRISTNARSAGDELRLAAGGSTRFPDQLYWDSGNEGWELASPGNHTYSGFEQNDDTQIIQWGENTVSSTGILDFGSAYGNTLGFITEFEENGMTYEAQVVAGDSGGGAFWYNEQTGQWELSGVLVRRSGWHDDQPGDTAVFGNTSIAIDLAAYQPQLAAFIPEPGAGLMVALGGAVMLMRRRAGSVAF